MPATVDWARPANPISTWLSVHWPRRKGNSVGKAIDWAKAATLIAAARTQQQFEEYQNWVIKAKQARKIIARRN